MRAKGMKKYGKHSICAKAKCFALPTSGNLNGKKPLLYVIEAKVFYMYTSIKMLLFGTSFRC